MDECWLLNYFLPADSGQVLTRCTLSQMTLPPVKLTKTNQHEYKFLSFELLSVLLVILFVPMIVLQGQRALIIKRLLCQ